MQVGANDNLLVKDHTHTFVNKGGEIGGMILIFNLSSSSTIIINKSV